MFATAIIVFREVLEAALVIGIVAAATHNIPGSRRWLIAGLLVGLVGAGVVAAFTDVIGSFASGIGQELFNAIVLGIAVLMLAWHNIWMSSHGAALAASARSVGETSATDAASVRCCCSSSVWPYSERDRKPCCFSMASPHRRVADPQ